MVTSSGELDHDAKLFTRTEVPPLILTSAHAVADTRGRLGSVAEVIDASGPHPDRVDGATVLKILADRRLFRVLTEGGPMLLSTLIEDGLLDEFCLTIAPLLVGGMARRVVTGAGEVHTPMRRSHLLTDDAGYLYTRYVRGRVVGRSVLWFACVGVVGPCPEHLDRRFVGFAGRLLTPVWPPIPAMPPTPGRPPGPAHREKKADGPPAIEAPKNDLSWHNCTSQVFSDSAVQPLPGVTLDCATYDADLDSINGATGSVSIGVVRARSVQTPEDAGPLVMTTGSDLPSSVQLPVWLSRAGADVLKAHPIVAVDRRGMGMSGSIDCRDLFDRQEMLDQAQFQSGDDPVANLGAITMAATTSCTDTIAPGDSAYDNSHAAEDIERLRSTWDVPTIALLGIGNGAQVALAYAGSHPGKVAGWSSTPHCRSASPPRPPPNSGSRVSRPRWTPSPRSAPPPTARWAPTRRPPSTAARRRARR